MCCTSMEYLVKVTTLMGVEIMKKITRWDLKKGDRLIEVTAKYVYRSVLQ